MGLIPIHCEGNRDHNCECIACKYEKLKQQRDDLLKAAKKVARPVDACNTMAWNEAWDEFEKAIARAEGE